MCETGKVQHCLRHKHWYSELFCLIFKNVILKGNMCPFMVLCATQKSVKLYEDHPLKIQFVGSSGI